MSFDIALSGIQAINEQLDTVSHNIANAGTYGYKQNRANFSTLMAGNQVSGTKIGSVTQNISLSGGILNTGRALDASINGKGFFVVKDNSGQTEYTRVGIFDVSKDGKLIDASGRSVQGFSIKPPGTALGAQGDITVPTGQIPAVASSTLASVGNMSADWKEPTNAWVPPAAATDTTPVVLADTSTFNYSTTSTLYDTLGAQHTMTQYFVSQSTTAPGSVKIYYALDGTDTGITSSLAFNPLSGQIAQPDPAVPVVTTMELKDLSLIKLPNGASLKDVIVDYAGTTNFAGKATSSTNQADGYASGNYIGVSVAKDGSVVAQYSNDQTQTVGKLAIANFANENGLSQTDDTSWTATTASGTALLSTPGTGLAGTLNTSSLEQSNVDITSELVGLMTSQRNYQANSKVISTESTMLQSLMQAI